MHKVKTQKISKVVDKVKKLFYAKSLQILLWIQVSFQFSYISPTNSYVCLNISVIINDMTSVWIIA